MESEIEERKVSVALFMEKDMATTPVFLPGESHGQRSLAGYSPWGHKDSVGHIPAVD